MSGLFKTFNVFLMVIICALGLCSLISFAYFAIGLFNIDALKSILTFITTNASFVILGTGYWGAGAISQDIASLIMLAVNLIFVVLTFFWIVCLSQTKNHYSRFRWFTFFALLVYAIWAGFNLYTYLSSVNVSAISTKQLIGVIISAVFIITFVYHLILNLVGKRKPRKKIVIVPNVNMGNISQQSSTPSAFFANTSHVQNATQVANQNFSHLPPPPPQNNPQQQTPPPPPQFAQTTQTHLPPPPPPQN